MLDIHEYNGHLALKAAGIFDKFREIIHTGGQASRVVDKDGMVLLDEPDDGTGGRPEVHRGDLRRILLNSLPADTIRWGHKVTAVSPLDGGRHGLTIHMAKPKRASRTSVRKMLHFSYKPYRFVRFLLHFSYGYSALIAQQRVQMAVQDRVSSALPGYVWTPTDFTDLGTRQAVDTALHRLVAVKKLRRLARGLYDSPLINNLTKKPRSPNPRDVIDALSRKGNVRVLIDGITAANDLGLTDAVPARITVLTDGRFQPIKLDNLIIKFQYASPSRLYWAGRPAMRFVQALYWIRDMLAADDGSLRTRLRKILNHPSNGNVIQQDLREGWTALPDWMRVIIRDLSENPEPTTQAESGASKPKRRRSQIATQDQTERRARIS
jgi:hypothetical protein